MKDSFSLLQLNEHLKRVVSYNLRESLWISCEISDVSNSKGTVYLSLVERNEHKIQAKAEAVVWKKSLDSINHKIGDVLWSILQIGRQVLLQVKVEYHELYGMKLIVQDIDPSLTIGQLELNRLKVLKQLQSEQFMQLNAQVPSSKVWQRIAVISSAEAAGLQDFIQQLKTNSHQYYFNYEMFYARVQGQHTTLEIRAQIELIEQRKAEFDCVVIVRGGGARLDLMGFDDYDLCVAIATCELPVLTGIGHDIDETIADKVAYHALKTPTAAADYLIHRMHNYEIELLEKLHQIKQLSTQRIAAEKTKLTLYKSQLKHQIDARFKMEQQQLTNLQEKLNILNPTATLQRGFSLVSNKDGQIIQSVDDIQADQLYRLHFKDGDILIKIN